MTTGVLFRRMGAGWPLAEWGNVSHLYLIELSDDHKPKGEHRQITFENGQATRPGLDAGRAKHCRQFGPYEGEGLWRIAFSEGRPGTPQLLPLNHAFSPTISRQ